MIDLNNCLFKVVANAASKNKASVGDIYKIDDQLVIVTFISKRYVYLNGQGCDIRLINFLKRNWSKHFYDRKAKFNASEFRIQPYQLN